MEDSAWWLSTAAVSAEQLVSQATAPACHTCSAEIKTSRVQGLRDQFTRHTTTQSITGIC